MNNSDINRLPNLFVIGAPKCGTTSLAYYLGQHPDIYVPNRKEIHFFDDERLYSQGYDFYKKHYDIRACVSWRVDATPNYMPQYSRVIPRITEYVKDFDLGDVKFIVLIRDPVYRAWSHYLHMKRNGYESLNFSDALAAENERLFRDPTKWYGYFSEGLYSEQLVHWFKVFGKDNFFVIRQDLLRAKPKQVLSDVFGFLNVDADFCVKDLSAKNVASSPRSLFLMKMLAGQFPGAGILRRILPMTKLRDFRMVMRRMNTTLSDKEPIPEDIESELRAAYGDDLTKLENILECDLGDWKTT